MAKVDGVAAASPIRDTQTRGQGRRGTKYTHAIDPATIGQVYNFDWKDGSQKSLDELGSDGVLLEETVATEGDFKVGDKVAITGPERRRRAHRARASTRTTRCSAASPWARVPFDQLAEQKRVSSVLVKTDQGASVPAVQKNVTKALAAFPEARARSQQELKDENADQINQLLGLFYALLAMSVIISAFGIVNTLTLSIFERTRELGLLRAVGMTRRDVRRMVRYESVITAVFGALLGLVLGIFFGVRGDPGARERGHHVLAADRADRLAADLRDGGRRGRGDLPGAAGVAARRAAGDRLRVAQRSVPRP